MYHDNFDRLGNRRYTPRQLRFHRWVQRIGFAVAVACFLGLAFPK